MRKFLIAPLLALSALSMTACDTVSMGQAPAPLAGNPIDEKVLNDLYETYDFILFRVDDLRDSGKLVPGSPKAKQVQSYLMTIKDALNAARSAQKSLNASDWNQALDQARSSISAVKALVK